MDAAAELAALRARAYGPNADIHLDPRALARLGELEGFAHPRSASGTGSDEPNTRKAIASVAAPPVDAPVPPASVHRRWKVPAWALVAGAAVVGITVGLIAPLVSAPQVVAQLRPTTEREIEFPFEIIAIDPTTLVSYDDFDVAYVWVADSAEGTGCLFVQAPAQWLGYACAPGELDPIVDVYVDDGTASADFLGLSSGSLVRFVLRDDVVEVWVAEAAPS